MTTRTGRMKSFTSPTSTEASRRLSSGWNRSPAEPSARSLGAEGREAIAMPSIHQTQLEMVQLVLPGHANVRGTLYGGRGVGWITPAAAMAGKRPAPRPVVLWGLDDPDFFNHVPLG